MSEAPPLAGNNHPLSSPHGVFEASDRVFNIAVGNEAIGASSSASSGARAWPTMPASPAPAIASSTAMRSRPRSTRPWRRIRRSTGSIYSIAKEFRRDRFLPSRRCSIIRKTAAREMLLKMPHPVIGTYLTAGLAAQLLETPGHVARPQLLGEHTEEVLRASGYSSEEIASLRDAKAINSTIAG